LAEIGGGGGAVAGNSAELCTVSFLSRGGFSSAAERGGRGMAAEGVWSPEPGNDVFAATDPDLPFAVW
jgi:hypothetical protein